MDPEVIGNWKRAGKEHPVALTELYAVCVARETWKDTLDDNRCIFFIDNQGDLDALIKGYSSEASMQSLLLVLERLDAKNPCMPWYCRVPSQSNIADLPSRGRWKDFLAMLPNCKVVNTVCPFESKELRVICEDACTAEVNGDEKNEVCQDKRKRSKR